VLVPPLDRLPEPVVGRLVDVVTAVDERVGADAVVDDAGERGDALGLRATFEMLQRRYLQR